jgi:CheY-like chemotaxis protein
MMAFFETKRQFLSRADEPRYRTSPRTADAVVLLVEDSDCNRDLIDDVFQFDNVPAALVTAECAEDAIDLAFVLQPSLILMDIRLPGMNGLEATRRLRSDCRTEHIPIWALTAHAMNGDAEQAVAAGCELHLAKPIDVKEFRARIDAFVQALARTSYPFPSMRVPA